MSVRIIIFFLAGLLIISCAEQRKPVVSSGNEQEVLYILPDGSMEFKGRLMAEKDVVIYKDGRGGERAAIKLIIPRHPDVYRDSIDVERVELDVPVSRRD